MENEIREMIDKISSNFYDPEDMQAKYDELLERFILRYDESLVPLMKVLIELEKDFWYS